MKSLLCVVLGLFLYGQSVMAGDEAAVEDILKQNLEKVFTVLQERGLEQQAKNDRIVDIVTPMFDFDLMAKLSLGRKHWPGLSQGEKQRFTELFVKRLKTSYLKNFTLYTDEKVMYEPAVQVKNKVHVPTHLISKDKKISMVYKFFKEAEDWKIYDLEIQGVSIIQSYRSQFNQILDSGTVDDLLLKLEKPADN
jgi:phospholipid transport system substrate-binding protein